MSAWDRQFHDMMTRFPHVGLKWLALILQNWPRDLPVDPTPGTTVTPVIRCSHQPCNSCFNECVACGWNGVHVTNACPLLKPLLEKRGSGGNNGRGAGGNHSGNGGNNSGGNYKGGQALQVQLASSVIDPGPSASVAGGGGQKSPTLLRRCMP